MKVQLKTPDVLGYMTDTDVLFISIKTIVF